MDALCPWHTTYLAWKKLFPQSSEDKVHGEGAKIQRHSNDHIKEFVGKHPQFTFGDDRMEALIINRKGSVGYAIPAWCLRAGESRQ